MNPTFSSLTLLASVFISRLPAGVAAQEASPLIGTWDATVLGKAFQIEFRADGTALIQGDPLRWRESQGQVTTTDERGKSQVYSFRVEAAQLTLSGADLGGSIVFARRSSEAGAAPASADRGLAGNWEIKSSQSPVRLTLGADGTGALNGVAVRWTLREGTLVLSVPSTGVTRKWQAVLSGDTLTIKGEGLPGPLSFSRSLAAGPDRRLVGTWQSATGAVFQFKDDQTVVNAHGSFRYSASGGILSMTLGSAVYSALYEISDDRLVLSDGGTQKIEFSRAAGNFDPAAARRRTQAREVTVNGVPLSEETVGNLERAFRVRILDGSYWYDRACGAWGLDGGPTVGLIPAGLSLGGPLKADASRGSSGVFVNGRELPSQDVSALQQLTVVLRGRYWIDALGNVGYEGRPGAFLNLVQLSRARSGSTYHSRNGLTGIGSGGNGETSYVMGKDFSVIIGK